MTTIGVIAGKWKPRILWHLRVGPAKFGDLQRATAASERMLSKSLRELERDGIVTRNIVFDGKVKTTNYLYTPIGATLIPVMDVMGQWGLDRQAEMVRQKFSS